MFFFFFLIFLFAVLVLSVVTWQAIAAPTTESSEAVNERNVTFLADFYMVIIIVLYPFFVISVKFVPVAPVSSSSLWYIVLALSYTEKKIPMKITVLAQYSCSIFIFLFVLFRRILKNMVLCMKFYTSLCKFSPNMVYHIFDYSME